MRDELKIGTAVNLLFGLRPSWSNGSDCGCPFSIAPNEPFVTTAPDLQSLDTGACWEPPTLSLHDDFEELTQAIFNYRVLPLPGDSDRFEIPACSLMLHRDSPDRTLKDLGNTLGISTESLKTGGFILLKMRRVIGECFHDVQRGGIGHVIRLKNHWTLDGRKAMCRLRVTEKIDDGEQRDAFVSANHTGRYIDYFHEFGTHFVSRIEYGDMIYQILACKPDRYRHLKKTCLREAGNTLVSGHLVQGFISFMGRDWIAEYGGIKSASGDRALTQSIEAGEWHEHSVKADCLLTPALQGSVASAKFLSRFNQLAATGLDFAPQSPFMGVYRACACKRLLKGAFLHKFTSGIAYAPQRNAQACDQKRLFGSSLCPSLTEASDACHTSFSIASDVETLNVPVNSRNFILFSGRIFAGHESGKVPVLRLCDEAFANYEFVVGAMKGALFVTNQDNTRHETIIDGLRFASVDAPDGLACIKVISDSQRASPQTLERLECLIAGSIYVAEALLYSPINHSDCVARAREWLEWLVKLLPDEKRWHALRVRAMLLHRIDVSLVHGGGLVHRSGIQLSRNNIDTLANLLPALVNPLAGTSAEQRTANMSSLCSVTADKLEAILEELVPGSTATRGSGDDINLRYAESEAALDDVIAIMENPDSPAVERLPPLPKLAYDEFTRVLEQGRVFVEEMPNDANPIFVFRRFLQQIRRVVATVSAIELWREHNVEPPLDRIEEQLLSIQVPAALPDDDTWNELPKLFMQALELSLPEREETLLREALHTFASAVKAWLYSLVRQYDLRTETYHLLRKLSANLQYGSADAELFSQKWRLAVYLVRLGNLLDYALDAREVKLAPHHALDIAEIAQSLLLRVRQLSRTSLAAPAR